jgi:hypothetical protein
MLGGNLGCSKPDPNQRLSVNKSTPPATIAMNDWLKMQVTVSVTRAERTSALGGCPGLLPQDFCTNIFI